MIARRRISMIALPFTFALVACEPDLAGGAGEPPYSFLEGRVEEALGHVEDARAALGSDRAPDAIAPLEDASVGLRKLLGYYLPLLDARLQVGRALDLSTTSRGAGRAAIDSARTTLEGIATSHGEHLTREMQEPLARLEEAWTTLESGQPEEARGILRRLFRQLEVLYFRGELVLEGSELDSPAPGDERD